MTALAILVAATLVRPVEAPKPDPRRFLMRLEVLRHGPPRGLLGLLGKQILTDTRTAAAGREASFVAAIPDGWDETAAGPGTRAEIRVTPTAGRGGGVWLFWKVKTWDRAEPDGPVRSSEYWVSQRVRAGEPFRGPDENLPELLRPGSRSLFSVRFRRGGRPTRIDGLVKPLRPPAEARKPPADRPLPAA